MVTWYIKPGQEVSPHIYPNGQDMWTIRTGSGKYYLDGTGTMRAIAAGDVVIASLRCIHGILNDGDEPLVLISVLCSVAY